MKEPDIFDRTYTRRKVESKANSTSDATLPRSIRANNHVQVRTGTEFNKVISDKVLELNPYDGSRHVSLAVIKPRSNSSETGSPIRISD